IATIASKAGLMPQLDTAVKSIFWLLVLAPALLEIDARVGPWRARQQVLKTFLVVNLSEDSSWQTLGITLDKSLGQVLPDYVRRPDVDTQLDRALTHSQGKVLNERRPVVVLCGERGTGTSRTLYESIKRCWTNGKVVVVSSSGDLERLLEAWPTWRSLPLIWCVGLDEGFVSSLRSQISRIRQRAGVVISSLSDIEIADDLRHEAWAQVVQHSPLLLADLATLIDAYPNLAGRLRDDGVAGLAEYEPDSSEGP